MVSIKRLAVFSLLLLVLFGFLPYLMVPAKASGRTVRVGYIDYGDLMKQNAGGSMEGYEAEYLDEIARQAGWNYEYHYDTWENCFEMLKDGQIDLVFGAEYSKERERDFDFSAYSVGWELSVLYVREDNDMVFYEDYQSFDGMHVGILKNSYQADAFALFAAKKGFSYVPVEYGSTREAAKAIDEGKIDAMVTGSLSYQPHLKLVASFEQDPFYIMVTEGNRALLDPLNDALRKIKTTDPSFESRLYEKYYGDSSASAQPMFTRQEAEYVRNRPVLKVASKTDWEPYEYWNPQISQYSGVNILILQKIAEISGIQFEFKGVKAGQNSESILNSGEVDLIASVAPAQRLSQDRNRTAPYLNVPMIQAMNGNCLQKAQPERVALSQSWKFMEDFFLEQQGIKEIIWYKDTKECLKAVCRGKADFTLIDTFSASALQQNQWLNNLIISRGKETDVPISIAVSSKTDPVLIDVLNKCILLISQKEINHAYQTAQAQLLDVRKEQMKKQNLIAIPLILLLFAIGAWLLYLMHRKKLERALTLDLLTGSFNLQHFKIRTQKLLRENKDNSYYLVKLDVMHFKMVNQRYGTAIGDRLLVMIANCGKRYLRPWEVLARIGDDQFVALVTIETARKVLRNVDHIQQEFKEALQLDSDIIVKCGAYKIEDSDEPVSFMIDKATIAHRCVKQSPKKHYAVYNEKLSEQIQRENQIESEMEAALKNGEFQIYLQPQVELSTLHPCGAEALIRWVKPDGSRRLPDEFIPLFERNGFIEKLDLYVLEQICKWLGDRIRKNEQILPISVNQSRYLLNDTNYLSTVQNIIGRYGIPRHWIELEMTESLYLENMDHLLAVIERLHQLGLRLSIDDFGSGYSSLNLLGEIPADVLKLDRAFMKNCDRSGPKRLIVQKLVELARELHIKVICEGVETKQQEAFLQEIGCDAAQGFLYARPMPIGQFDQYLREQQRMGREQPDFLPANP